MTPAALIHDARVDDTGRENCKSPIVTHTSPDDDGPTHDGHSIERHQSQSTYRSITIISYHQLHLEVFSSSIGKSRSNHKNPYVTEF